MTEKIKSLIVEDEFVSRNFLQKILAAYGETHVAINGEEAVEEFAKAFESKKPYDLICLDIKMPKVDGHEALEKIRAYEKKNAVPDDQAVKIIMNTICDDPESIMSSFMADCNAYIIKPVKKDTFLAKLIQIGLI